MSSKPNQKSALSVIEQLLNKPGQNSLPTASATQLNELNSMLKSLILPKETSSLASAESTNVMMSKITSLSISNLGSGSLNDDSKSSQNDLEDEDESRQENVEKKSR